MEKSTLLQLLRLRLLVGAAGELTTPPWWRTQFCTPTGFRQLNQLFPRSALRAALESVSLAAAREHDERVGSRAVHLFRLPSHVEQRLAALLSDPESLNQLSIPTGTLDALTTHLEALAGETQCIDGSGPRNLGPAGRLTRPSTIAEIAAAYGQAIRVGIRLYPYFEMEETE